MSRIDWRKPKASGQMMTAACAPVAGWMNAASQVPSGVLMSTFVSTTCCCASVVTVAANPAAAMPTKLRRVISSLFMCRSSQSLARRSRAAATAATQIIPRMTPALWLTSHVHLLPPHGAALDVACGRGRHAIWLSEHGLSVVAVDRDADKISELRQEAAARHLTVVATARDLESGAASFGTATFDVVVVIYYLYRQLFPALVDALRPGGL